MTLRWAFAAEVLNYVQYLECIASPQTIVGGRVTLFITAGCKYQRCPEAKDRYRSGHICQRRRVPL